MRASPERLTRERPVKFLGYSDNVRNAAPMNLPVSNPAFFHRPLPVIIAIILALLVTKAATAGSIMPADELDSFFHSYYLHPQPERIADAIESVSPSGFVQKKAWGVAAFFGEIFAAHPDQLRRWKECIARQDKPARDFLQHSLDLSQSGGTLALKGHSSGLNDMYWGAFFATGNPAFVHRLIDTLRYFDERKDLALFQAGATAKWSLVSNGETHPLVRKTLADAKAGASQRTREIIDEMFRQSAGEVRREMKEIIEQQRAAGIWK